MKDRIIWVIFWIMVAVFIIIVGTIFIGVAHPYVILSSIGILFGLGVALLVLTIKKKVSGMLRVFWLLTGASAVGLPVFAGLHNLVYALFIRFFGADFWGAGGDEPFFFILAIIVCPIAFLVGAVGTIVLVIKNKLSVTEATP